MKWATEAGKKLVDRTRPLKSTIIEENPYFVPRREDTTGYLKLLLSISDKLNNLRSNKVKCSSNRLRIVELERAIRKVRLVFVKLRTRDQRFFYADKLAEVDVTTADGWKSFERRIKKSNAKQVEESADVAGVKLLELQYKSPPPEAEIDFNDYAELPENEKFDLASTKKGGGNF